MLPVDAPEVVVLEDGRRVGTVPREAILDTPGRTAGSTV